MPKIVYPSITISKSRHYVYYNAFRNWPINKATVTGELDDENLSILISKSYIEQIGYLTSEGYWDFNWETR